MVRLNSTGVRLAASFSAFIVALIIGFFILKPFLAATYLSKIPLMAELSSALSIDNKNPSHHYRMGLHRYYDPQARDLDMALASYVRGISLSPANAIYWIGLAKVYESKGRSIESWNALERARTLNPTYVKSRWMKVNFHLARGESMGALGELREIIKWHPLERWRAFGVLHMVTKNNVELIVKEVMPVEQAPMEEYLSFLISRKQSAGVKLLWRIFTERLQVNSTLASRYIDYLVSIDDLWAARRYFDLYEGRVGDAESPQILNGGFEDDICSNRLCWWIEQVPGVRTLVDEDTTFAGKRSLKVEFDGSENVNFRHIFKAVPLLPNTRYELTATIKSDSITTLSGLFIEFYGTGACKFRSKSELLRGSSAWKDIRVVVSTPGECGSGIIKLRRLMSDKLDNRISGSLWIDNVRLTNLSASSLPGNGAEFSKGGAK